MTESPPKHAGNVIFLQGSVKQATKQFLEQFCLKHHAIVADKPSDLDVLPGINVGDSYRVAVEPQSPRRVPASSRLPRGFCAWFLLQIPTMGNLTASNQPHIPPGLTDSPQADTARPAAGENFNTTCSLYPLPKERGFTEYPDNHPVNPARTG